MVSSMKRPRLLPVLLLTSSNVASGLPARAAPATNPIQEAQRLLGTGEFEAPRPILEKGASLSRVLRVLSGQRARARVTPMRLALLLLLTLAPAAGAQSEPLRHTLRFPLSQALICPGRAT
jgi:hypothetical protein